MSHPLFFRTPLLTALLFSLLTPPSGAQEITSMSAASRARSGRLVIFGSGFGASQGAGQVTFGGEPGIVMLWSEAEIHAYVPESSPLGSVPVVVETDTGPSDPAALDVTLRQPEGRFLWRFETDLSSTSAWSARGPDGRVYTSDINNLYALSPDGALLWAYRGAGGRRPITFLPDGAIVAAEAEIAGQPQGVVVLETDGTLRWLYDFDDGYNLMTGPGVGPDGNIYATSNTNAGGPGTFSLDPAGNLRWTNPGPGANTINHHEIDFASDRFYVSYNGQGGPPSIIAYTYDGDVIWNSGDLGQRMGSAPELLPDERIVLGWGLIGEQVWFPDGSIDWIYDPPGSHGNVVVPAVGPDGVIYNGTWLGGDLFAVDADGNELWFLEDQIDGFLWNMGVAPDNSVLVDGGAPDFGEPSRIRAFDPQDGSLLWVQSFHFEDGLNEFARWAKPVFTPDGRTAYVTTGFSSGTKPGSLYAVDVFPGPAAIFADGFESGDLSAWTLSGP